MHFRPLAYLTTLLLLHFHVKGQNLGLSQLIQVTKTTFNGKAIEDSTFGIMRYEKYNKFIGGDSVRIENGMKCNTWVEDYYPSGKLMHKGFYVEGKLNMYKNYYANGQEERSFRNINEYRCNLKIYHTNGKMKSDIDYSEGYEYKTVDFYPNGNKEYVEELDKGKELFILKEYYYENGILAKRTVIENKKKKWYSHKEFYEDGKIKEEGTLVYSPNLGDYIKDGIWKLYDKNAKLVADQYYIFGEKNKETKY